jgi:hypothetical protein
MGLWTRRMGPEGVDRRDSFELSWTADVPSHSGRMEFGTTEGSSIEIDILFDFRTYSKVLRWGTSCRARGEWRRRARASCGR